MQIFMIFYDRQLKQQICYSFKLLKQQICYSFKLLISYMVFIPFKMAVQLI